MEMHELEAKISAHSGEFLCEQIGDAENTKLVPFKHIIEPPSQDLEVAEAVMARRNMDLTDEDRQILTHVFETSASYRKWENS